MLRKSRYNEAELKQLEKLRLEATGQGTKICRTCPSSISGAVKAIEAAFKRSSEMSKKRLEICNTCHSRVFLNCKECGCFVHLKTKLEDEKCPLNKW